MSARFVYWMNVSLDLFIERDDDEQGGGDWLRITDRLHADFNERARALTAMVQGRRVYETMENFWPAARDDESLEPVLREYGAIWTDAPKVLVSRKRTDAPHSTRAIGADGDAIEQLARMRAESDGDIGVGGADLATQLLDAGLLDELVLYVHPVVLGTGRPLFDGQRSPVQLDLVELRAFDEGVALHRYAIRR
ncbi:dihydrofolate reductase family protein [Galbitalea sp. SE-J8]|uniref:dihydrofolate reductase family protein n=1 Tax=Galbitalea sp. SE-J8 TaxID=3054952 RepID=UPI00259C7304|nr:dihydrofolate reductase family protein [Galbitalea sp. SE-J8]MDM4763028.1 dihydrofolate reductase family protein [Galbitalea sp. SE-J8]